MRIIYFDIDTLRADHLGCYGYHRRRSDRGIKAIQKIEKKEKIKFL